MHLNTPSLLLQATQHTAQLKELSDDTNAALYRSLAAVAGMVFVLYWVGKLIKEIHADMDDEAKANMDDRFLGSSGSTTIAKLLQDFFSENHSN